MTSKLRDAHERLKPKERRDLILSVSSAIYGSWMSLGALQTYVTDRWILIAKNDFDTENSVRNLVLVWRMLKTKFLLRWTSFSYRLRTVLSTNTAQAEERKLSAGL